MEDLALKIKISVLWLFYEAALLAYFILMNMEPAVLEKIAAGEIEELLLGPEILFLAAVLLLVPLVMAFLSLILKDSANRWANIVLGIVFTVLQIFALIDTLALAQPTAHAILLEISKTVVPALIVWYAWKWPKK